jgi:SAM-dependent methyltransferase
MGTIDVIKTITEMQARQNLGEVLEEVYHKGDQYVIERAGKFGVDNRPLDEPAFVDGQLLRGQGDVFDAILFCEILEHITFNPSRLWQRIYELTRVGGIVYVTTPNALKLLAVLGALWNLLTLRRIGMRVDAIFEHVTYGHHWKEYSRKELPRYFALLSPDFEVTVEPISYGPPSQELRAELGWIRSALLRLGNALGGFSDNLEAVVKLRARTRWLAESPPYG